MEKSIKKMESLITEIIDINKDKIPEISGVSLIQNKILVHLTQEDIQRSNDDILNDLSGLIIIGLDKSRKNKEINNLPILRYTINQKLITIEI